MISKNKVVSKFYNPLDIIWVVLLEQEEKFGFNCRLVVVFFLVFDKFDGH